MDVLMLAVLLSLSTQAMLTCKSQVTIDTLASGEISGEDVSVTTSETDDREMGRDSSGLEAAVARVGDRWSLLIMDALLEHPRRFKDLESAVQGLAPNVLSARLRHLEQDGLIVAEPYSLRPVRYEYRVSTDGKELAGALKLLASWGARAAGENEVPGPRHGSCGTLLEARWYCPTCDHLAEAPDESLTWL
jgi:DNA-binding HxlR family transcriptional regulator